MIVQNEQENGQPRPASIVPLRAMTNRFWVRRDARGSGASARSGGALEEIVDRLEPAGERVQQDAGPPALHFAQHQRDPGVEQLLALRRRGRRHRHRAADVEAADDHVAAVGPELSGEILRAGDLVGLDADEPDDDLRAVPPEAPGERGRVHARDDLVNHLDAHLDLRRTPRSAPRPR